MMIRALLVAMALLAVPGADAALSITADDEPLALPPGSTTELTVTGTVNCQDFVTSGSQTINVALTTDAPAEWGAQDGTLTFNAGPDCLNPAGTTSTTGTVSFTPNGTAMGLIPEIITITASGDADATFTRNEQIWVDYQPGHVMETDIDFPYTLTDDVLVFNLTVTVTANTDSMVMFERLTTSAGSVTGLGNEQFFFTAGEAPTRVKTVTWTPPSGDWDNATIEFYNYSHCLIFDFGDCGAHFEQNLTWTILNGGTPTPTGDEGEDSPGAGLVAILAAIAAIVVARRR